MTAAEKEPAQPFPKLAWLSAVRRQTQIPIARRTVIEHIGDTADRYGRNAWRSTETVCAELGVSLDTVKRGRRDGVIHGLWVVSKAAPKGAGNTKTAEYRLLLPPAVEVFDDEHQGDDAESETTAVDSIYGGTRASISEINGGTSARKWVHQCTEIGAPVHPPSGISSGNSSGERARARDDEPLDVETVPDRENALSLQNFPPTENDAADAEAPDAQPDDDTPPPKYCHNHMPNGAKHGCHDCKDARLARHAWDREHAVDELLAEILGRREANAARSRDIATCELCDETGWVLTDPNDRDDTLKRCDHGRAVA